MKEFRKKYQKPVFTVVRLNQPVRILAGSLPGPNNVPSSKPGYAPIFFEGEE